MKRTVAGLSLIAAAVFGVVAAVPAPALASARTATVTLECDGFCTAGWAWYEGGTVVGSGSLGNLPATVTTVQPAAADTLKVDLAVNPGPKGCGTSQTYTFSAGSGIDFTLALNLPRNKYHNACDGSLHVKS
jgi:hypothetical protein